MKPLLIPALYFLIKYSAYATWCRWGVRLLDYSTERPLRMAALLGIFRLVLGVVLGWGLIFLMLWIFPEHGRIGFQIPQYVFALVLLRWIEWSIISAWLRRARPSQLFPGKNAKDYLWRAGGVALSFVTDAGVLFSAGLAGIIPC